jgi:tetratricopeptide (TPR) repeat protein
MMFSVFLASVADRVRASLAWGLIQLHSGDFKKADQIGRETREVALGAELAREVGEASGLIGMVAHMQGGWRDLFRSEFIEWVRAARPFASHVFDGNLCLAEYSLASPSGHVEMARQASELLQVAEQAKSVAGRALATLILGQAELFSGRLDESERLLDQAEQLHVEAEAPAGRVLAIQRLAEAALARGQKYNARRMVERALRPAKDSWLKPHLQIRLSALLVQTAANPQQVEEAVLEGDRRLTKDTTCQPCSMGYRAAAAIALAEAGEIDQVGRRLDEADRLAGMWSGGPWVAALWEARGVLRRAQGGEDRARAAFAEAAGRFAELGRPIDQARCTARISA